MGRILLAGLLLTALHAQADLIMSEGHVRAMPPGQPNTAAFLTLQNTGNDTVTLISAQTPAAKKAEFHTHIMNDKGVMSMSKVPHIEINSGQTFQFKSGAHHVMFMGLTKPLSPGTHVSLTLQDNKGSRYTYEVPVQSILEKPAMNHHHHHQE